MSRYLKNSVKDLGSYALYYSGIMSYYLKAKSRNAALILAYHRINTREFIASGRVLPGMYLSDTAFELHLEWLTSHYQMVTVSEVVRRIRRREEWSDPICAITFDDGWFDNYEYAFPILKKYEIPSTIFIVGNNIGKSEPDCFHMFFEILQNERSLPCNLTGNKEIDTFVTVAMEDRIEKARIVINKMRKLDEEEFDRIKKVLQHYYHEVIDTMEINEKYKTLSWCNMREMQQYGVEFGYHSKNHYMLTQLSIDRLHSELVIPCEKARLNGVEINNIFCYPDGQFNNEIINFLTAMDYEGAVSLKPGFNKIDTDPFALYRINIHESGASTLPRFMMSIVSSCARKK